MNIGGKVKTFFEHIGEWLKANLGSAASDEHTAATTISMVSPLLVQLVSMVAGSAVAAKVQAVVTQITNDLNNTSALLLGASQGDQTAIDYLNDAKGALSTLLADADVKNAARATEIQQIGTTVINEIEAIVTALS
jgi:hypothetical protein